MSKALPEPIWLRRASGKRPPVTEKTVIDAALDVLDDHGVNGITMRAVAERMGVSAPTVYWHVENKEGLFERLYDRLCSEVPQPPPGQTWDEQLRALANAIRAVFARHRDAARFAIGRFPLGPSGLQLTETTLAALTAAGLDDEDTARAAHLFFGYVTSFCYQETVLPAPTASGNRAEGLSRLEQYLSSLPVADFPHLTRCAAALARPGLDERFAFGLDRLLAGLLPSTTPPDPTTLRPLEAARDQ